MKKIWLLYAYILVGIGAFLISYTLEAIIFLSISRNILFCLSITAVLELCKVLTIVFQAALKANNSFVPPSIQNTNIAFKLGLIALSLVCSIAIISKSLDRPNLESVKAKEIALAEKNYSEKISKLETMHEKNRTLMTQQIKEKYKARKQELKGYYEPRIEKEERLRDYEFNRVINGIRKGPNWNEHNRLAAELKQKYRKEIDELQNAEDNQFQNFVKEIEADYQSKINAISEAREKELKNIEVKNYVEDERVKNQLVSSLLFTLKEGLGINLSYLKFTLLFSILISILLEGVIYITFNYSVLYFENIINKKEQKIYAHFEQAQPAGSAEFSQTRANENFDENMKETKDSFEKMFGRKGAGFQFNQADFNHETSEHDPCSDR